MIPKRAFCLKVGLQADTKKALLAALDQIAFQIDREGLPVRSVSGGYDSGWIVEGQVDEAITHDRYIEQLNAYLAEERKRKEVAPS